MNAFLFINAEMVFFRFLCLVFLPFRMLAKKKSCLPVVRTSLFNPKGFTIIELMIVITMFGILAAIGYPTMRDWKETHKINSSAMDIKKLCDMAKSYAIKNQKNVFVNFSTAGTYGAYLDNGAPTGMGMLDSKDQLYQTGKVKDKVTLLSADFNGTLTTRFNPLGLTTDFNNNNFDGYVILKNVAGTIFKKIKVEPGGIVRILSSKDAAGPWVE